LRLGGDSLVTGKHFSDGKVTWIRFVGVIRAVEENSEVV
jgi:hypothetical protein